VLNLSRLAGAVMIVATLTAGYSHASGAASSSGHPPGSPRGADSTTPLPDWSLIATLSRNISAYPTPGAPDAGTIPATWNGAPSALPVIDQRPGWLQVRLASRPNGSVAWVLASDVSLTRTPYRIVINLTTRHLQVWNLGQKIVDAPAGIGTDRDPTVTGHFFMALFERPPNSSYGPFVIVTSAHSNTITDWEQSGDALIAIHGPLDSDTAIGATGARVTHGCVRLHLSDLAQLRDIPVGTPIDITT
jgi:hypothetical protein